MAELRLQGRAAGGWVVEEVADANQQAVQQQSLLQQGFVRLTAQVKGRWIGRLQGRRAVLKAAGGRNTWLEIRGTRVEGLGGVEMEGRAQQTRGDGGCFEDRGWRRAAGCEFWGKSLRREEGRLHDTRVSLARQITLRRRRLDLRWVEI